MKKRLVVVTCFFIAVLIGLFQMLESQKHQLDSFTAFSQAVIQQGSKGSDVLELQGRLKHIGFYQGKIDGDFGGGTLQALKRFQSEFGLTVDGAAGPKTKLKLWEATKSWKPTANEAEVKPAPNGGIGAQATEEAALDITLNSYQGLSSNDLKLMANAVYGEARGEPYEGQIAVAAVILNRVKSPLFPNTVSGVIFQPGAFTAVADGQIWLEPNDNAKKAVQDALSGMDPTGNCIYYFNPVTATSKWIWTRTQIKTIGKHIFCK